MSCKEKVFRTCALSLLAFMLLTAPLGLAEWRQDLRGIWFGANGAPGYEHLLYFFLKDDLQLVLVENFERANFDYFHHYTKKSDSRVLKITGSFNPGYTYGESVYSFEEDKDTLLIGDPFGGEAIHLSRISGFDDALQGKWTLSPTDPSNGIIIRRGMPIQTFGSLPQRMEIDFRDMLFDAHNGTYILWNINNFQVSLAMPHVKLGSYTLQDGNTLDLIAITRGAFSTTLYRDPSHPLYSQYAQGLEPEGYTGPRDGFEKEYIPEEWYISLDPNTQGQDDPALYGSWSLVSPDHRKIMTLSPDGKGSNAYPDDDYEGYLSWSTQDGVLATDDDAMNMSNYSYEVIGDTLRIFSRDWEQFYVKLPN